MSEKQATYLGDGVYAEDDAYCQIRLYTSNGITVTNEIFLEPQAIDRLNKFANSLWNPIKVVAHHELKKEWEK
jgi:hypothetical protein